MFFTIKLYLHLNCILMLNWIVWNRTIFIKMDLNNLQKLICHKTQTTNQPTNQPIPSIAVLLAMLYVEYKCRMLQKRKNSNWFQYRGLWQEHIQSEVILVFVVVYEDHLINLWLWTGSMSAQMVNEANLYMEESWWQQRLMWQCHF